MANFGVLSVSVIQVAGIIWEGEANQLIARTTEGDIGILPGHTPVLAILVNGVVEIVSEAGEQIYIAIDGGYISVEENHVAVLCQYGTLSEQVNEADALRDRDKYALIIESGKYTDDELRRYHLATAQVKTIHRIRTKH